MSEQDSKLVATQDVGSPLQLGSLINTFSDRTEEPEQTTELDKPDEDEPVFAQPAQIEQTEEPSTIEEPEEEPEEAEEEPEESSPDDDPYGDYSEAALIAETYKQNGRFPQDLEVNKDLSWPDFMNLMDQYNEKRYEQAVRQFLESAGQTKEYIEFVLSGGSQETLNAALSLEQLTQLDTEEEENREALITAMYQDKGMDDPENIKVLLEGLKLKDKDTAEAEKAKEYFKQRRTEVLMYEAQQRKEAEEYQRRMYEQEQRAIMQTIDEGDLGPIKLETDSAKKQFLDALFKPTEQYQYRNERDEVKTAYITKYQKRMQELQQDVKGRLILAKLVLDGLDNLDSLKEAAKQEGNQDLLKALEARTTKKTTRKSKPEPQAVWSTPLT